MSLPRISDSKVESCVQRLRELDITQFYTICRMHLSFLIELDMERFEEILTDSTNKVDAKTKRTGFGLKKKGSKESLLTTGTTLNEPSIVQLGKLLDFLSQPQNLEHEGLFRKSGNISRQKDLKEKINTGEEINFDNNEFSAHDCASTLKNYLGELPEPLLMDRLYAAHCQASGVTSEEKKIKAVQLLFLMMPTTNLDLLKKILLLLHQVAATEANKMSADALGTMFSPHILCPRKMSATELQTEAAKLTKATAFMISNAPELFKIPTLVGYDVVQYLKDNCGALNISRPSSSSSDDSGLSCRKRARSVDEDETDAAHTVVSFVDREASQHIANTQCDTEVALAQLYAHVQGMPESAKKRKLLKQFNRNGVATPAEAPGRRHKRSRSLGESLKKRFLKNHKRQQSSHSSQNDSSSLSNISSDQSGVFSPSTMSSPYASPQIMRMYKKHANASPPVRVIDLSKASSRSASLSSPVASSSSPNIEIIKSRVIEDHKTTIQVPHIKHPLLVTPDTLKLRKEGRFVSPISYSMRSASKELQEQLSTPRSRVPLTMLQTHF